jgi:hypothetical protein
MLKFDSKNTSGVILHLKCHNIVHAAACATARNSQASSRGMYAPSQKGLQYSVQKHLGNNRHVTFSCFYSLRLAIELITECESRRIVTRICLHLFLESQEKAHRLAVLTKACACDLRDSRPANPHKPYDGDCSENSQRQKELDAALLKMGTEVYQPLSIVEDAGFRTLVSLLDPKYNIPNRKKLRQLVEDAYEKETINVRKEMSEVVHVSLTTDIWTSMRVEHDCDEPPR